MFSFTLGFHFGFICWWLFVHFSKMKMKTVRFDVVSFFQIKNQMILCTEICVQMYNDILDTEFNPPPKVLILLDLVNEWNSNGWIYVNGVNKLHLFCFFCERTRTNGVKPIAKRSHYLIVVAMM